MTTTSTAPAEGGSLAGATTPTDVSARAVPASPRRASRLTAFGFLFAVLVVVPAVLAALDLGYPFRLAQLTMIFIILSASLNLVAGTAGLLSLGHAAFYGVGAYTTALLATNYGTPLFVNLAASALVAGVLGFLVAIPTIRLVRIFFAVATLSVGEIITLVIINWYDLTRGPMGVRGIPSFSLVRPPSFAMSMHMPR